MAGSRIGLPARLIASCTAVLALFFAMPAVAAAEGLLQVVTSGNGAGSVASDPQSPALIDCPGACSSLAGPSRTITLHALPEEDSTLGSWSVQPSAAIVSGCGSSSSCTVFVASAPDQLLTGPGGFTFIIPHTAETHVTATFVRNPDGVFLCYSRFQVDPGVWPATVAPALFAGGYWQPYAILGTRSSTRLGAYSLVCNPPASAVISGRETVDSGGAVITDTRALGLYPIARL